MAQAKRKKAVAKTESDSGYFLKILLYFMVGLLWIKINGVPLIPIGLIAGLLFSTHEHFQIDRKIEYAILLIATLISLYGAAFFISINT